jgi:hypothetical protein
MTPIVDPRNGDIEDDSSSTKQRSVDLAAGSLLAESICRARHRLDAADLPGPAAWGGAAVVSIWITSVWSKAPIAFAEVWPALLLLPLAAVGWLGARPLLRLAESSFWSLNALAVQPAYIMIREGLRHLADKLISPRLNERQRASVRAGTAAGSGLTICGLGFGILVLAWPASRWTGTLADLTSPLGRCLSC